jgi:endonuclease/exonuclease/phosphatase family metal-dependent hydrolase
MSECAQTLCVATYNIHGGLGRDRRVDFERVADVILDLDADVIALQEVETPATVPYGAMGLVHRLDQQGYHSVHGPTLRSERGSYGNVLITRLPVMRHFGHDLSEPGREPRGLIEAHLSLSGHVAGHGVPVPRQELHCCATHLGLRGWERRRQIERLVERIDRCRPQGFFRSPVVLLGDFNEWHRRSGRLRPIQERLETAPLRPTYPSYWPLLPLDRIWFGGGLRVEHLDAVTTGAARIASDHLPLRATLVLGGTT